VNSPPLRQSLSFQRADPSNLVVTRSGGPDEAGGTEEEIEKEEAQLKRKTFRTWWSNRERRALWVLAGAPPWSLDAVTIQNVLQETVNATRTVCTILSSMSSFDVRAFAPRGADSRDAIPIDTRLAVLGKSLIMILATCLPGDPEERRHCSERIGTLDVAFERGLIRQRSAASRCTRALALPTVVAVVHNHINRDVGEWTSDVQSLSASMEHSCCSSPPASATEFPPVPVPTWHGLITFLDSGSLDLQQQRLMMAPPGTAARKIRGKNRPQVCPSFQKGGDCQRPHCKFRHPSGPRIASTRPPVDSTRGLRRKAGGEAPTAPSSARGAKKAKTAMATREARKDTTAKKESGNDE